MTTNYTISQMITAQDPNSIVIDIPDDNNAIKFAALTYRGLGEQILQTQSQLNTWSIGRGDRVAIVLPNCPEMATVFIAVASSCTAAPLNMAYTATDFEFYLNDIKASAVIIAKENGNQIATEVANRLQIPILWLENQSDKGLGRFTLMANLPIKAPKIAGSAQDEDVALILHTSGTTSRPKIVPLSHRNVVESANNIRKSLQLSKSDRGLHVMPMFHIHGLIAALLAPLSGGGTVIVTPGFNALKFFSWMENTKPTWYTAVPTMHQALLVRSDKGDNAKIIKDNPLRFIRSSSSSIPTQVISEIERVFSTPLIEAYGMTEAAHQMCSNPLPPAERRPGSVGQAAGPEVAIMDDNGHLLKPNEIGEVVIRGANVTSGYENNPEANAKAYMAGWFRTGDQGSLSEDGYLTLTGRLKEIINRGGEKISPLKIDEALMDYPEIQQVVTFAMPHKMLGEAVAAVVVLKEGHQASESEIKSFASTKLSKFEIPEKIIFMNEIPKGATGKLQRIGLWEKLVQLGAVNN